jgi:uncharacterized protein
LRRRPLLLAGAAVGALWLAGCATPSPSTRWYTLRIDPPLEAGSPAPVGNAAVWELSRRVSLPGELMRDTLLRPTGAAGLQPLVGHRWAEPLQDSVPRLLLHDLRALRGADRVWAAPAPAGVVAARQLRVDLLSLQPHADGRSLRLQARWLLIDPGAGAAAPQAGAADLQVPLADGSVDALAAGHRLALWRLAERIAADH